MPTTIAQGFEGLRRNLEITTLQEATVSTRQTNVKAAVEAKLKVLDDFLTGSYRRSTMIAPLKDADVDIFVVLDPSYYSLGPAPLLDKVRAVLRERYPDTPAISRNGQAVTITFTDFRVDVVPGFYRNGGGYLIADSALGRWIATDPKAHVDKWTAENKAHQGDLVPLIKMIKAWNRTHSALLHSFHLETIVLTAVLNVTISDFSSGARYVFDKARALVRQPLPDPAGYNSDVGGYLNTSARIAAVVERLTTAYDRAVAAERSAAANQIAAAFERWQLIFGSSFPAYG